MSLVSHKNPNGEKYWRYDIKITLQKPFRKNMRSNIK
jgi:hypothetical protein